FVELLEPLCGESTRDGIWHIPLIFRLSLNADDYPIWKAHNDLSRTRNRAHSTTRSTRTGRIQHSDLSCRYLNRGIALYPIQNYLPRFI
ncbi:MAG TPA: hypothetical protein PKH07_13825, partial [bacterium]|nr:hypothetical protein [bacterium]